VFDAVVFEANQFQPTYVAVESFTNELVSAPKVKPSLSNEVTESDWVCSALLPFDLNVFVEPLMTSLNECWYAWLLAFTHKKSGWNPTPVIDCVALVPLQVTVLK